MYTKPAHQTENVSVNPSMTSTVSMGINQIVRPAEAGKVELQAQSQLVADIKDHGMWLYDTISYYGYDAMMKEVNFPQSFRPVLEKCPELANCETSEAFIDALLTAANTMAV